MTQREHDEYWMALPTRCVWKARAVKIDLDGMWAMSARGDHRDWQFFRDKLDPAQAVAGRLPGDFPSPGSNAVNVVKLDENKLSFEGEDGRFWILEGDPCEDGRFYEDCVVL